MKKGRNGHLQERNHFDSKDMILLVVTILIIYGVFTWIFSDYGPKGNRNQGPDQYQSQYQEQYQEQGQAIDSSAVSESN